MLEELSVADLGVIARARLPFGPGMTAITGETGAGKTMLLAAVGLVLGEAGDPGLVRKGAAAIEVTGTIVVDPDSAAARAAREAGAELDDGALIVSRTVPAQGRSRAYLGGRAVPRLVLSEVLEGQLTIHGQSSQLRLRSAAQQREVLDEFAGPDHAKVLADYRAAFASLAEIDERLARLHAERTARQARAQALREDLALFERVEARDGEDVELDTVISRLSNVEDLRQAAAAAHAALAAEGDDPTQPPGAEALVAEAQRMLAHGEGHDPRLDEIARSVREIGYLVAEAHQLLASYLADLDADPGRLEQVQARRAEIGQLMRAHGPSLAEALAWEQAAARELAELLDDAETIEDLTKRRDAVRDERDRLAAMVGQGRVAAGEVLTTRVNAELAQLAMGSASLDVRVTERETLGPYGAHDVEFLLRTHPSAAARPLAKAASGGELSRVMLALEVCLAGALEAHPTLIFDEIDAGVGGRAAQEIGRRLQALSASAQVIVVTHLPQVAAFAGTHLVVTKLSGPDEVDSQVRSVSGEARVTELARMLAGQADSESAREHARELLEWGEQQAADGSGDRPARAASDRKGSP